MSLHAIILAAGSGTRMRSPLPKVLHTVLGKRMIEHVLDAVYPLVPKPVLVVGYGREEVQARVGSQAHYALQEQQLGTGHAVKVAHPHLVEHAGSVFVLAGDMPLVSTESLEALHDAHLRSNAPLTVATAVAPHFENEYTGLSAYGRIIRNTNDEIERIVEYKDASDEERAITEVNAGVYCFDTQWLFDALSRLESNNAAGEFYLTDTIEIARRDGYTPCTTTLRAAHEALGANTPEDIERIERLLSALEMIDTTTVR